MSDLKKYMDIELLQGIQDQFSTATGMAVMIIDSEGKAITKGSNFNDKNHFNEAMIDKKEEMDYCEEIIINGEKVGSVLCSLKIPHENNEENKPHACSHLLGNIVNQLANHAYTESLTHKRNDIFDSEMNQIHKALQEVTEKTRSLQKVASMENILSINASIEAARAGEAGVGFAVVAREFGEISKDSGDTYERIQKLVEEIQTSIKHLTELD